MTVLWLSHEDPIEPSQLCVMSATLNLERTERVEVSGNIRKIEFHISVVRKGNEFDIMSS